jgi:hypothetical protein
VGEYLDQWILYGIFSELEWEPPAEWGTVVRQIMPGNPIQRMQRGYFVPDTATPEHLNQLSSYIQSLHGVARRGRRPEYEEEKFRQDLLDAYQQLYRKNKRQPSQSAVAEQLLISKRHFERCLQRFGIPWPPT